MCWWIVMWSDTSASIQPCVVTYSVPIHLSMNTFSCLINPVQLQFILLNNFIICKIQAPLDCETLLASNLTHSLILSGTGPVSISTDPFLKSHIFNFSHKLGHKIKLQFNNSSQITIQYNHTYVKKITGYCRLRYGIRENLV